MKAQPDKIGIAAIKLNNLKEEGLTRKEFIAKSRAILFDLVYEKTNDNSLCFTFSGYGHVMC